MNVGGKGPIIGIILAAGLVASSGTAVYYKARVIELQERLATPPEPVAAVTQPAVPTEPIAPTPRMETPEPTPPIDTTPLVRRIAELEADIAERNRIINDLQGQMALSRVPRDDEPRPWRDRNTWMEEMRTNDPVRYEQMMERREESRRRTDEAFARKATHFLYRDTGRMTETEKEEYDLLIQLLNDTWRLHAQLASDLPRDERWELRRAMGERMAVLDPMLRQERDRALVEMGHELGYRGDAANQFADYIHELIDITSFDTLFRGGRGGGPPFGGPGGGPGPSR